MGARTSSRSSVVVMSKVSQRSERVSERVSLIPNGIAVPCRLSKIFVETKQNYLWQELQRTP